MDYQLLADTLRRFAGTLVQEYDLEEVLVDLSPSICRILDVHGAGVMLEQDDGHLHMISTSDPLLRRLEQLQVELDEGPCLLAYRTGQPVQVPDLRHDARFPRFGTKAADAGMLAVYSYPMRHDGLTLGALNFYRTGTGTLDGDEQRAGAALADVASAYLLHARSDARSGLVTSQLQQALDSRVPIEQAKGYVAARLDVGVDEAFALLRDHARSRNRRLHEVARDVVARRLTMGDLRRT